MSTQTIRQSTILIASGERTSVYSSLEQVPAALKEKLLHSTSGANSATILLADRAGREEIVRALRGMPSHVQARLTSPKLPWTEAFARKHSLPDAIPPAVPADAVPIPQPSPAIDPSFGPLAMAEAVWSWSRQHWAELLLPVGVAIGLWALLAS